ncbi:Conserved oligomeric Golgi complex subunit [Chytridiales sp. JEL 0842]|nr:Conserved oligomeric Golgi complex subunit [Chytridiales sp. JEL 0842]
MTTSDASASSSGRGAPAATAAAGGGGGGALKDSSTRQSQSQSQSQQQRASRSQDSSPTKSTLPASHQPPRSPTPTPGGLISGTPSAILSSAPGGSLPLAEYQDFARDDFDPTEYANQIIRPPAGKTYHRSDITTSLSKLGISVDHLNKQIHDQVGAHYEELLAQVTGLSHLEKALDRVKTGVSTLNDSFNRVRSKVTEMHDQINYTMNELEEVQTTTELLRRVQRFVQLSRKLESQLKEEKPDLSQAAVTVNEIETVLQESDLSGIHVVDNSIPKVTAAKEKVISEAEKQLQAGLDTQNQGEIAASLQVFRNLGQMALKSQNVVEGMLARISDETKVALDPKLLGKEIGDASPDRNGKKTLESLSNSTIYAAGLWKRFEKLMDVMYENSLKMYIFERVLSRKKDPLTHVKYLDEVAKTMDGNIAKYFWNALSQAFEREIRLATKSTPHFHQIFQIGYPKLLRLFHDFFSRLSVVTSTSLTSNPQNTTAPPPPSSATALSFPQTALELSESAPTPASDLETPKATILLRTLTIFETAYLRESLSRLLEPINAAFPDKPVVGVKPVPTRDDVEKVLRTVSRELEVTKFDPHLFKAVAKNVAKALNMYSIRSEQLVATDSTAFSVSGAGTVTSSQVLNIAIVNCLWRLADGVWAMTSEFEDETVVSTLDDSVLGIQKLIQSIIEPLLTHITREIESTIIRIHKEDYGRPPAVKPKSQSMPEPTASAYILEVGSKLRWNHREIMSRFQCGSDSRQWHIAVASRVLDFFVRHASLVRPLNEAGKLKLTSDMTQLEFALNQWMTGTSMKLETATGDSYKALRAFRHLLFLDLSQISAAHHTATLPPIIIAHHLIVRAYPAIHLPMTAYNWSEAQYSEWLDAHTVVDSANVLLRCLDAYVEDVRRRGEKEFRLEYPLVRTLLQNAVQNKD